MSNSHTPESTSTGTSHTLAGDKRQRSRQVCTQCRQKKIKCDAQDTFPAPCSCCMKSQPAPLCRVDPNYRRTRKLQAQTSAARSSTKELASVSTSRSASRKRDAEAIFAPGVPGPLSALSNHSGLHTDNPSAALLHHFAPLQSLTQTPVLSDEQLAQVIWPSVFELGGVQISVEQATMLFDEFFNHYHPNCPLFLNRRAPAPTHRTDPLLFWTILTVASRRPPIPVSSGMQPPSQSQSYGGAGVDGAASANVNYSYLAIAEQVKASVAALGIYPPRKVGIVQALLLLCEWPLPTNSTREDLAWHYSSLAIQTAIQIGLHRPQFSHEFSSRVEEQAEAASVEGQERTLAWIYCHIIGYSIAAYYGIPSLPKDDYVTLSASSCTPASAPPWLARVPRRAIDALRIARLTDRIASTLGHTAYTPSGQLPAASTVPLFSVFTAELGELERNIGQDTAGEADVLTRQRLHLCRIRLCVFMLQSGSTGEDHGTGSGQRALATTDCYVSCMRLIETAYMAPRAELARWPTSVSFGYSAACICLIRLLSTPDGAALDTNAALTQVSALFRAANELNRDEDALRGRFNRLVSFSVRDAHLRRTDPGVPGGSQSYVDGLPDHQSRMGLPNWCKDCIGRAKQSRIMHEAVHPGRGAEIISCANDPPAQKPSDSPMPTISDSVLCDPPLIDFTMFMPSDFDDILASFSEGEWSIPTDFFAVADCPV